MLELQTVRSPLDPNATLLGNISTDPKDIEKEQENMATKILNDVIYHIIQDTLVSDTPEMVFKYEIPVLFDTREMSRLLKKHMYDIFHKNMYTMPYISFITPTSGNNNENHIIINAEDTVLTILHTDKRLNTDIKKCIETSTSIFLKGDPVQFDGLSTATFELPDIYIQSRVKFIVNILASKNYLCEFNHDTKYLSISYKGEKQ